MQRGIYGAKREQVTGMRRELGDWCCLRDVTRCHVTDEVMAGSSCTCGGEDGGYRVLVGRTGGEMKGILNKMRGRGVASCCECGNEQSASIKCG